MGYWMTLASAVTNIGSFEAEMSSDSITVAGMADRGILPKALAKRNENGAPVYGIVMSSAGIILLGYMSFNSVVDMLNLLYCFGQVIEFLAYLKIRHNEPTIHGVDSRNVFNFSFITMLIILLFPCAFIVIIVYFSSITSLIITFSLAISGFIFYFLLEYAKRHNFFEFEDIVSKSNDRALNGGDDGGSYEEYGLEMYNRGGNGIVNTTSLDDSVIS
jgi:L-asparagine transporter-like permease